VHERGAKRLVAPFQEHSRLVASRTSAQTSLRPCSTAGSKGTQEIEKILLLLLREPIKERDDGFGFGAFTGVPLKGMDESTIRWAGAVEPLRLKHDRLAFACGVDFLEVCPHKQAGQDFKKHAAVPFVLTSDGSTIPGCYWLSQYAVQLDNVPAEVAKKLPRYPLVPTTFIGRLAVSLEFRG
jgi:hypothetical protein